MSNPRKRPRPHQAKDNATSFPPHGTHEETHDSPLDACVQGYEATLTYDQEAFAKSLRLPEDRGGQLMRWIGSREAETDLDGNSVDGGVERQRDVWIDRCARFFLYVAAACILRRGCWVELVLAMVYQCSGHGKDELMIFCVEVIDFPDCCDSIFSRLS
jgi:hypothetical protein